MHIPKRKKRSHEVFLFAQLSLVFFMFCISCGRSSSVSEPLWEGEIEDSGISIEMNDRDNLPEFDQIESGIQEGERRDTEPSEEVSLSKKPNILLVILDDFGLDASAFYRDRDGDGKADDNRSYASTPTLDGICTSGVTFMNAWATPLCSSTRSTILTGRYGFRTGIGGAIPKRAGIRPDELTLPKLFDQAQTGYAHANIGKWHLGNNDALGGDSAPNKMGWSYYAGSISGSLDSFTSWKKVINGVQSDSTVYATTDVVDESIQWLKAREPNQPWFLWMAFNAPHTPFHLPPQSLHKQGQLPNTKEAIESNPGPYFRAAVEAVDHEVKRLLDWLKENQKLENTVVVFLGDNGSPNQVLEPPYQRRRAKGSLYQGGIHIPMCMQGPFVKNVGSKIDSPVNSADLFATFLKMAGVDIKQEIPKETSIDGVSFLPLLKDSEETPLRQWNFSQIFTDSPDASDYAFQIDSFKFLQIDDVDSLFDLRIDPLETNNLLARNGINRLTDEQKKAYEKIKTQLNSLLKGTSTP